MAGRRHDARTRALHATVDAARFEAEQRLSTIKRALLAGATAATPPEALVEALRRQLAGAPEAERARIRVRIALAIADLEAVGRALRDQYQDVGSRLARLNRYSSAMTSYARWTKPRPARTQGFHGPGRFQQARRYIG